MLKKMNQNTLTGLTRIANIADEFKYGRDISDISILEISLSNLSYSPICDLN